MNHFFLIYLFFFFSLSLKNAVNSFPSSILNRERSYLPIDLYRLEIREIGRGGGRGGGCQTKKKGNSSAAAEERDSIGN